MNTLNETLENQIDKMKTSIEALRFIDLLKSESLWSDNNEYGYLKLEAEGFFYTIRFDYNGENNLTSIEEIEALDQNGDEYKMELTAWAEVEAVKLINDLNLFEN